MEEQAEGRGGRCPRRDRSAPKQAAHIHFPVFDAGEPHVGLVAQMNLEIRAAREVPGMQLETDPRRWPGSPPCGENPAGGSSFGGNPGVNAKLASGFNKGLGQARIEPVPADSKRGDRQALGLHCLVALVPDHLPVAQCIRENRRKTKAFYGDPIQTGDELATNPVARIAMRLKYGHRHAPAPQSETQAQTGQPATHDLNRLAVPARHAGIHFASRRQAIK